MPEKFNPDDLKNPLYEHSQVITLYDLRVVYHGLAAQHQASKWWQFRHRYNLAVAGYIVYELLTWLYNGKPALKEPGEMQ